MHTLAQAQRHIDSIARPSGYSHYAWNVAKKLALQAWKCYLYDLPFTQNANYLCPEFYDMVTDKSGEIILPTQSYRALAS